MFPSNHVKRRKQTAIAKLTARPHALEHLSMSSVNDTRDAALDTFLQERGNLIALACSIVKNEAVAEELVQDSWIRWRTKSYPDAKARPIFRSIVANLAKDFCRRRSTEQSILSKHFWQQQTQSDCETIFIARQDLLRVVKTLKTLPPRSVDAYRLYCTEGLNCAEIGRRMGLSRARAYEIVQDAMLHVMLCLHD